MKYATQFAHGYFHILAPDSYLRFLADLRQDKLVPRHRAYQALFVVKAFAALCLAIGYLPHVALVVLSIDFAIEIRIFFKFHTCFFCLLCVCLLLSPDIGAHLTLVGWLESGMGLRHYLSADGNIQGDLFSSFLIGATVGFLYLGSAVRKLNVEFLSGRAIFAPLRLTWSARNERLYADGYYPSWFMRLYVLAPDDILARRWYPLTRLTIAIEFLIVPLICIPTTSLPAIMFGVAFHSTLTLLYPRVLMHFSVVTVAACLLLLEPRMIADIL